MCSDFLPPISKSVIRVVDDVKTIFGDVNAIFRRFTIAFDGDYEYSISRLFSHVTDMFLSVIMKECIYGINMGCYNLNLKYQVTTAPMVVALFTRAFYI